LVDGGLAGKGENGLDAWVADFEGEKVWVFETFGDYEVQFGREGEEGF
jgi:hypothetical protein